MLYLESNRIEELTADIFTELPNLEYLDVRFNQLTRLPASIGRHRKLKTLLLQVLYKHATKKRAN